MAERWCWGFGLGWLLGLLVLSWAVSAQAQVPPVQQCVTSAIAGGTGDALTIPLLPCTGTTTLLVLKLTATNASSGPTLQEVGYPALPILNGDASIPSPGQLASGSTIQLTNTGSSWTILNNMTGCAVASTSQPGCVRVGGGLSVTGGLLSAFWAIPGVICDGLHDVGPAVNAAFANGEKYTSLPPGTCYTAETITVPKLFNFARFGGSGGSSTILTTDQNIPLISVGTYAFTGVNDWSFLTDPVYSATIDSLVLINTSLVKTNSVGIALNGAQNGIVFNIACEGIPFCVKVNPISAWNFITNISAIENVQDAVWINGTGYGENLYNSTGNIYSNIQGQGVSEAVMKFSGCTFGDVVIQGVQGIGIASGGMGSGGGAIAGVYMDSTGVSCADGAGFYAHNIAISGVDMDGVADYVVRGTWVSGISVGDFVQGGNVTNGVSFDSNSSGNMIAGTLNSFVGTYTHVLGNDSGLGQSLTGMGFIPSKCHFSGSVNGTAVGAYTVYSGESDSALRQFSTFANAGNTVTSGSYVMNFADSTGGKSDTAAVASYTNGGLGLTWNGSGTPAGTATFVVGCQQ